MSLLSSIYPTFPYVVFVLALFRYDELSHGAVLALRIYAHILATFL